MQRSRGERENSLKELQARYEADVVEKIRSRTERVSLLADSLQSQTPTPDVRRFVARLSVMAETQEPISGRLGGRLAFLTEKQMSYLAYIEKQAHALAPEPTSRAARFAHRFVPR